MGSAAYKDQTHGTELEAPITAIPVEAPKPVDTHTILKGIDVYNGDRPWNHLSPLPDFISCKATQGLAHNDAKFKQNRELARSLGIPFGAYHFATIGDGLAQAKHFCEIVGSLQSGDLPPCLDWEETGGTMIDAEQALVWLKYVEDHLGIKPMVYCGFSKVNDLNLPSLFAQYPLWFAHPGANEPVKLPRPWKTYFFWQNAFGETTGGFDTDIFHGSKADLQKWTKQ